MITELAISQKLRDQIAHEAKLAFPRECCGLIEGVRGRARIVAAALHPARNIAPEADRFKIDPAAHIALAKRLRATRHEIVGCYHSHPNGRAEPSDRDVRGAWEKDFAWIIAASADSRVELRAYILDGSAMRSLRLMDVAAAEASGRSAAARRSPR